MEDITDTNYTHVKKVYKNFEIKNLGQNSDLCFQGDTLLLAGGFENFQNICLKIYEPDPASFVTAPGLIWQAAFKRTKVKLDLVAATEIEPTATSFVNEHSTIWPIKWLRIRIPLL